MDTERVHVKVCGSKLLIYNCYVCVALFIYILHLHFQSMQTKHHFTILREKQANTVVVRLLDSLGLSQPWK